MMAVVFAVVGALLVGFVAGLLTFRLKQQWCPMCGETLRCTNPAHRSYAQLPQERRRYRDTNRNAAPAGTWGSTAGGRTNTVRRPGEGSSRRTGSV